MVMSTKNLAVFLQKAVAKDRSQIADCGSCMATPFGGYFGAEPPKAAPHVTDEEEGFLASIPWPWIAGTLAISVPLTGFLTFKMSQSMAKSELGLKLFNSKVGKRKKRKGKRKSRRR